VGQIRLGFIIRLLKRLDLELLSSILYIKALPEIKDLHGTISGGKEDISRFREEIQQAKTETQTVSGCLKGVVEALSYTDDQAKAIFALGAVKDKCASAERIVKRIEDTRDEQPISPRTNNIIN